MSSNFTGLWKRKSIRIGDFEPYEDATVLWLQAKTYFADIRVPFNQPSLPPGQSLPSLNRTELLKFSQFKAFAGTIDATESWIRWNRQIDFKPNPKCIDQGRVYFEDGNLIEVGEFLLNGSIQPYLEVWVPQSVDTSDCLVLELTQEVNHVTQVVTQPRALAVAVGEHFIRVYDDRGYPAEFEAPDPEQLSSTDLRQLMQFQVDYGKRAGGVNSWQILLSNDPSRVGMSLQAGMSYQSRWQDKMFIETWRTAIGENLERHWQVREEV